APGSSLTIKPFFVWYVLSQRMAASCELSSLPYCRACLRHACGSNNGNVGRCLRRAASRETGIVEYLDLAFKCMKARAKVEIESARMVESTGVHPKAANRFPPRTLDCVVHEKAPGAMPDKTRQNSEKCKLTQSFGAKIKLDQSLILAAAHE